MDTIVTPGLVLKETRYKESDRIITLLTPGLGVISASAQSSLRLKSKLFSACGLFCYSEFVLLPGRNMYTIREAEVRNVFHGISSTIEGMSLAMYLAEMAAALSPTGEEAAKELRLLLNCLYMISEGKTDLHVVKAVFELRTMSECGFLPQLVCCKICEKFTPSRTAASFSHSGMLSVFLTAFELFRLRYSAMSNSTMTSVPSSASTSSSEDAFGIFSFSASLLVNDNPNASTAIS